MCSLWRLDRLGRNLKHLITLLDEFQSIGVAFVSLAEGIDATTPAGKLQMHILGAIAEFERERIRERVMAGLQRARSQGTMLGSPCASAHLLFALGDERRWGARYMHVSPAAITTRSVSWILLLWSTLVVETLWRRAIWDSLT
jgi:hypothetical protein